LRALAWLAFKVQNGARRVRLARTGLVDI